MTRFERLAPGHPIGSFVSGHDDLDQWLRDAAPTADRAGTARVYVWVEDKIIGYFAIVPHGIRREDVPSAVGRGAPDVIPGFLLARLALAEDLHGRGLGGELLAGALDTVLSAIRVGGGRVVVVDAILPTVCQPSGSGCSPMTVLRCTFRKNGVKVHHHEATSPDASR